MRSIKKSLHIRPESIQLSGAHLRKAIKAIMEKKKWYAQASTLYSSKAVTDMLELIYRNKCCYCEVIPLGSPPQVEHYRPKNGVEEAPTHTGYYWLAYEWTNLLYVCGNCNSRKNNKFPIEAEVDRVLGPTLALGALDHNSNHCQSNPLAKEKPLLVNPELEDCTKFFKFSSEGKILGIGVRGIKSVEICDLNRDELFRNGRQTIIQGIRTSLFNVADMYVNKKISASAAVELLVFEIEKGLIFPILEEMSFTQFYKTVLLNFDLFFINPVANASARAILRLGYYRAIKFHIWEGKSSYVVS